MSDEVTSAVSWSFDELQPASGAFELGAANRFDPYYADLHWGYPALTGWLRSDRAHEFFPTRPARHMKSLTWHEALDHVFDAGGRTSRHTLDVHSQILGAVHGWKTCTAEQVAALTGRTDLRSGVALPYATAVAAGLINLGQLRTMGRGPRLMGAPEPNDSHERLLRELGFRQLLEVTGGEPWTNGPQHPRHNVLATELALRIPEYAENVATVLPESFSRLHDLAGPERPSSYPRPKRSRRAADLTVVRTDGLRIAIELTATRGKTLERKIEAYAKLFAGGAPDLVVLFVLAPSLAPEAPDTEILRRRVHALIRARLREVPGNSFDLTSRRFGVVMWGDWFPCPGLVSEQFFALTAQRAADRSSADWAPAAFLEPSSVPRDLEGRGLVDRLGGVMPQELARVLGSTPYWLRGSPAPEAMLKLDAWVSQTPTDTSLRRLMFAAI